MFVEPVELDSHSKLISITKSTGTITEGEPWTITLRWDFTAEREVFPWMALQLIGQDGSQPIILMRGLCAPQVGTGSYEETWRITAARRIPPGEYFVEALFFDNTKRAWSEAKGTAASATTLLCAPVPAGSLHVLAPN